MAKNKKIAPDKIPETPYPGKRPETIPAVDPEEPLNPEENPDIIPDPEEEEPPVFEEPAPGEGP
ncbi:MAG: hypothetical protein HYZ15_03605 [Sphingobacteriales bacterium]|nr:hypothetical protein [Sphingobacteriales bacterium]